MLDFIHIENVALIKQLDIDFSDGFTAMTGETGSGKSMVIDSINFVLGQRPKKDIIRNGEEECYVYAVFSCINEKAELALKDFSLSAEDDNTLMISRRYNSDGKSVSKINNRTVPVSVVRAVASYLVSINEQHDSYSLLNDEYHVDYLDAFAETLSHCHLSNLSHYKNVFKEYNVFKRKLNDFLEASADRDKKLEFLKFQKKEIESAKIKVGEERELSDERELIKNSELISNAVKGSLTLLSGGLKPGAYDKLVSASDNIEKIKEMVSGGEELYSKLQSVVSELDEIIKAVSNIDTGTYDDPTAELDRIEGRLELISKTVNKYGESESDVLEFLEQINGEISELEQYDFTLSEYENKVEELKEKVIEAAESLNENRLSASKTMSGMINSEFEFLDMEKVKFDVVFSRREEPTEDGLFDITFVVRTNPGEPYKNISSVASGGELSRVMLSLKKVLSSCDDVGCVIFDEIDTGVSGKTSSKIGISLKELSQNRQVICVTHSAQVSAIADTHYKISKKELDGRMFTLVQNLNNDARINEIARILGGVTITESVINTATELIEQGKNI